MPNLMLPLTGDHIRSVLRQGKDDQDKLRREELEWLHKHNALFGVRLQDIFKLAIRSHGIDAGDAVFIGSLLGHRSIRACVTRSMTDSLASVALYNVAMNNFQHNSSRPLGREVRLAEEGPLTEMFGDPDLVSAFLDIRSPDARDSAATIISFCGFDEVPVLGRS